MENMTSNSRWKIRCPNCSQEILVSFQGIKVASTSVSENAATTAENPKLSRLHALAIEDLVQDDRHDVLLEAIRRVQSARFSRAESKGKGLDSREFVRTRSFDCPQCSARLNLSLDIEVVGARVLTANEDLAATKTDPPRNPPRRSSNVNEATETFIQACREQGLLTAFEEALREQWRLNELRGIKMPGFPKLIERYFATFLRQAVRGFPADEIFSKLKADLPDQDIQYWHAEGVGVITLDGQIYRFVPSCIFDRRPRRTEELSGLQKVLIPNDSANTGPTAETWVRTKFGYVPMGKQLFLDELRRKSLGSFANPTQ